MAGDIQARRHKTNGHEPRASSTEILCPLQDITCNFIFMVTYFSFLKSGQLLRMY